eukprot:7217297-Prymnesium_polylepis.1
MVRRKAVFERYAALRCLPDLHNLSLIAGPAQIVVLGARMFFGVAYGLWCAERRYSDAARSCGASGT